MALVSSVVWTGKVSLVELALSTDCCCGAEGTVGADVVGAPRKEIKRQFWQ